MVGDGVNDAAALAQPSGHRDGHRHDVASSPGPHPFPGDLRIGRRDPARRAPFAIKDPVLAFRTTCAIPSRSGLLTRSSPGRNGRGIGVRRHQQPSYTTIPRHLTHHRATATSHRYPPRRSRKICKLRRPRPRTSDDVGPGDPAGEPHPNEFSVDDPPRTRGAAMTALSAYRRPRGLPVCSGRPLTIAESVLSRGPGCSRDGPGRADAP